MVVTLGQQYNIGKKPTLILNNYINRRHDAGTPKQRQKHTMNLDITWFLCEQQKKKKKRTVCVCVFSSHSFRTSSSLDIPAGVTQEEGHTGFHGKLQKK